MRLATRYAHDGATECRAVEVVRGMRERERTFTLLDGFITQPVDRAIAGRAGEMLRAWQSRGVILAGPDAIIAASALQVGAALVTTNARRFPMSELVVLAAGEDGQLATISR